MKQENLRYDMHVSLDGWIGEQTPQTSNLVPDNTKFIQALKIRSTDPATHLNYMVYWEGEGWSDPVCDGAMCGTAGQHKRIHGIKIWHTPHPGEGILEYRTYSNKWSEWHPNGAEIINPAGFSGLEMRINQDVKPTESIPQYSDPIVNRLNMLAVLRKAERYLEIGVRTGATFLKVITPYKTGVDPAFAFDISQYAGRPDISLLQMKSDDFFEIKSKEKNSGNLQEKYDLIYIDGLHTWQQALKDFVNSQAFSTKNTVWIFDDTLPSDPWSAVSNSQLSYKIRRAAGVPGGPWHGDVFKVTFLLHDLYPNFSYATVIGDGNPQTIVWQTPTPVRRKPILANLDALFGLSYFDLLDHYRVLNPIPASKLESFLDEPFESDLFAPEIKLEEVISNNLSTS